MNRIMFAAGIMIMIASALLFVFIDTKESAGQITVLLIIGIVLAAASKYRILIPRIVQRQLLPREFNV